jgi:hypothetical protein
MEINITRFFNESAPMDYFASRAEIGDNAGPDTWNAACEDAPDYDLLDNDEKREAFKDHIRGFGAWGDTEIAVWSNVELNALFMQVISSDIRQSLYLECDPIDWDAYYADENESRNIFHSEDGEIYYNLVD